MELATYFRFVLALAFVIGLIGALAWAVRRFGLAGRLVPRPGRARRVQIMEITPLDGRHKLVLIQRDTVEHLLLVGPGNPLLVERGILVSEHERDGDGDFARTLAQEERP
mgnify:CR=1 FL=1